VRSRSRHNTRKLELLTESTLLEESTEIRQDGHHASKYSVAFDEITLGLDEDRSLSIDIERPAWTADEKRARGAVVGGAKGNESDSDGIDRDDARGDRQDASFRGRGCHFPYFVQAYRRTRQRALGYRSRVWARRARLVLAGMLYELLEVDLATGILSSLLVLAGFCDCVLCCTCSDGDGATAILIGLD